MHDDSLAMLCRASLTAPTTAHGELMYMPGGLQSITPVGGGIGQPITVLVDHLGAGEIERQRAALAAQDKRPYFDFNHADGEASFWPEAFYWKDAPSPGIYCRGEWSARGRTSVEGREWRQFSPVFHVDNKRGNPARIVCREQARPNMGGLVNDPAFHTILPLWAKHSAGAPSGQPNQNQPGPRPIHPHMTTEEMAALQARNQELQNEVGTLQRQQVTLRARADEQTRLLAARQQADAEAAVQRAIGRHAIPARDVRTQEALVAKAADDPTFLTAIEAMQGPSLGGRLTFGGGTGGAVQISGADPRDVLGRMNAICARQGRASSLGEKAELARDLGTLYAAEFRGANAERMLDAPIQAADSTDPSLNSLAGSLVTMRTLELLKLQFPALTRFTTDFSDQTAQFNQTIITRIVGIPSVTSYSPTGGWTDSTGVTTTDVPVKIDQHKGVQISFNTNVLASTSRRLFDEFAPANAYALGKALVDALYGNITDANFTNNTVKATASFSRSDVIDFGTQLTLRGVPQGDAFRTMLLYPTAFAKLAQDPNLVTFAAFQRPAMFEAGRQMTSTAFPFPVHGFEVHEAANLPTNNGNITGFGGSKSALVLATRLPNDYTSVLPGAAFGNVSVITLPDVGISVMLVEYVDHQLGKATRRMALMYGTAPGQSDAGQLLKAAAGTGSSRA